MILVRPSRVDDALAELADGRAIAYAGGLDVLHAVRSGATKAVRLVDTKRIAGARGVSEEADGIRIGPATRHHEIATDPLVARRAPLLAVACGRLGTVRVRMQGTIGGNLALGSAQSDPGTAALVHGGRVTIAGPTGWRRVAVADLWPGRGGSREARELIVAIHLDRLGGEWRFAHERLEILHRPPTAIVSFAARVVTGRIAECRVAVAAASAGPVRVPGMEAALTGHPADDAVDAVVDGADPLAATLSAVCDEPGSRTFERRLVVGLVQRAAARALRADPGGNASP
jgi:carbon-monoxide dehydrogenase medium subunit